MTLYVFVCVIFILLWDIKSLAAAPTDIILSSTTIVENSPFFTIVGNLSTTDTDGDSQFSYSLVPGTGSGDNSSFMIWGNLLLTYDAFDYESQSSYFIRIQTSDGSDTYEKAFTITILEDNGAPVLYSIENYPLLYTEDQPAVVITSSIRISDSDDKNMRSATVSIMEGFDADEDRLSFNSTKFTVERDDANGILTISGKASIKEYRKALRKVSYVNINNRNPSLNDRVVQFVVNDGTFNSNLVFRIIEISGVNDAPEAQEDTYGDVLEGGILTINASEGILNNDEDLDGPNSLTAYLEESVQFGSIDLNPDGSFTYIHDGTDNLLDEFTYRAYDGIEYSDPVAVTLTMTGTNDPPELSAIESTVLEYTEDSPPRQVTSTLVVSDEDNLRLQSAVIHIDNNFIHSEDSLIFTPNAELTVNYVPADGILHVSGEATLLIYQNFLRSLRYVNTNELSPSTLIRRITFTVNDGILSSITVYRYIQVIPQNDPPIATNATIRGTDFHIGQLLTADYTYTDPDGDMEGNTSFRWYMADNDQGTGRTLINTSQQDTLTPQYEHGGKWIQFVVRPFDINGGEGVYDTSEFRYINAVPVLNRFTVINEIHPGVFAVDEIVQADFTYFDVESDQPGTHTYQWHQSNTGSWLDKQPIPGADSYFYTITNSDKENYIALEAVPLAASGSSPGRVHQSEWYLVSETPSAVISGEIEMCEGGTDFLTVTLTGDHPPWSFRYVIEGTTDTLEINKIPATSSDYQLEVTQEGRYILVDISDHKFDFGIVTGTGLVSFFPPPTAELTMDELSICDNDEGIYTIPVQLSGTAPWSYSYNIVGQPAADSVYISNINSTSVNIEFTVDDLGTYSLLNVWDANCMAPGTGNTDVILRDNPRAIISGDNMVCPGDIAEIAVDLSGVGPWTYYYTLDDGDEVAVNINQAVSAYRHVLEVSQAGIYRLTRVSNSEDEGCVYGMAYVENFAMPSATLTSDITMCEGSSTDIPVLLTGTSPWTLSFQHNLNDPVEIDGIIQNPYLLHVTEGGSYRITSVTDKNDCRSTGTGIAEITRIAAPEVTIHGLDTIYTITTQLIPLFGEPAGGNYDLSDENTVWTVNDFANFSPWLAGSENSPHRVIYTYQDPTTACIGRDTVIVHVFDAGGNISVDGETEKPNRYCSTADTLVLLGTNEDSSIGTFSINGSEDELIDNGNNSAYLIPSAVQSGQRTVTYSFTISGQDESVKRDFFFERIDADFTWDNECFTTEALVKLTDKSLADSDIDSNKWEIRFSDHSIVVDTNVLEVTFNTLESYPIEYVVVSKFGCRDTLKKDLVLKPTYPIFENPYFEDFTDGESDWEEKISIDSPNSWRFGVPAGKTFIDPGKGIWYTDIEDHSARESSYVISPCFDLSEARRPMIKMDIWQAFAYNVDGAKLQYQTEENATWYTVGSVGMGENWYNSSNIQGIPGDDGTGWTGTENGWKTARHKLDNIPTDQGLVRFRIAYGAPHNNNIIRDGFAFDDIWVGERTKRVLIEHFTNMGIDASIKEVNRQFNSLINTMNKDVVDIQYHMNRPGPDTFYDLDNSPPDSRDLYYSLPNIPYAIIDGGRGDDHNFLIDFRSENIEASDLDLAVLIDNQFDIEILPTKADDYVNIDITVTSLENLGPRSLTVHVVIIERLIKDVVSDWGESEFESVVRAMLPNAVGSPFNIDWGPGTSRNVNLGYNFQNIFDIDEVRIVAFIQDNDTREIYQTAMVPADPSVGVENKKESGIQAFLIYPNPANQSATIEFYRPIDHRAEIQILDNAGRLIRIIKLYNGDKMYSLDLLDYDPGIYLVRFITENEILEIRKLLILGNNR